MGDFSIIEKGGFGQPIAYHAGEGGVFLGLEYPTSENILTSLPEGKMKIESSQEVGEKISA